MKIMEELWLLSQLINLLRWWRKLIWSIFTIQWNLKKTHSSAFLTHWHFLPSQWTLEFPVYGSYYGISSSILMKTKRIIQEKKESMIYWQIIIIDFMSRLSSLMELMENLMMVLDGERLCQICWNLLEDILTSSNLLIIQSDIKEDVIHKLKDGGLVGFVRLCNPDDYWFLASHNEAIFIAGNSLRIQYVNFSSICIYFVK